MKYKYTGMTRTKEQVTGVVDADDEIEAKMKLRAMQIRPINMAEEKNERPTASGEPRSKVGMSFGKPIDLKGMMVFTRQFSSLVDSGVPIVQCLEILAEQEKRPVFKQILVAIKENIESGAGLAESLEKYPKVFGDFFVRIVEAGELSGTLDTAMRRVGVQLEKLGKLRSKVIGALMYPAITMVVAVTVLVFLLIKVVPEVAKLYAESSAALPQLTVYVLSLSAWLQANFLYLFGGVGGFFLGFSAAYKTESFRQSWDPFVLKVPLFGALVRKSSVAKFTRTMATLIQSGVPLLAAFDICVRLIDNRAIKKSIEEAASYVAEGKSIAAGLQAKGIFPPMVIHMVNIGEMTGRLDDLMAKVADIYDDEVDDAVGNLTGLLQPAMIVVVGIIVAFLLLSMYLPIFQLAEKVTA